MQNYHLRFNRAPRNVTLQLPAEQDSIDTTEIPEEDEIESTENRILQIMESIAEAVSDQQQDRQVQHQEVNRLALALAIKLIKKMAGCCDQFRTQRILETINQNVPAESRCIAVAIHPDDLPEVQLRLQQAPSLQTLELNADQAIAPGECRLSFETHDLVSSIEYQLETIESSLQELLDES